jgi:hypothetical protein
MRTVYTIPGLVPPEVMSCTRSDHQLITTLTLWRHRQPSDNTKDLAQHQCVSFPYQMNLFRTPASVWQSWQWFSVIPLRSPNKMPGQCFTIGYMNSPFHILPICYAESSNHTSFKAIKPEHLILQKNQIREVNFSNDAEVVKSSPHLNSIPLERFSSKLHTVHTLW